MTPSPDPQWQKKAEAFFAGELSEAERTAFEREMAKDPAMAREVYAAVGMGPMFYEAFQALRVRHLEAHARIASRSVTKQVPWWGRTRSRLVVTVAVAALVFLAVFVSNIGQPPPIERPVGPAATEGFRGVYPVGEISPMPVQFIWTPHPNASQYRFEIFDESSQQAFSTLTERTSLVVAADALWEKGFRAGSWRVVPLDPHGAELEATAPLEIRIEGP